MGCGRRAFCWRAVPGLGRARQSAQWHADALADCARRLCLAATYQSVPRRYQWVHDSYTAALDTTSLAPATASSYLHAVDAFLRWLGQAGHQNDLRRGWAAAAAAYLEDLACTGRVGATVRRRRAALGHCAALLHLPAAGAGVFGGAARGGARLRPGESALACYQWAGRRYYVLASPAGTRVIISTADLPLPDGRTGEAAALLAQAVAAQMFRAPLEACLAWAAVGGTQIILLAGGDHAHLAERGAHFSRCLFVRDPQHRRRHALADVHSENPGRALLRGELSRPERGSVP